MPRSIRGTIRKWSERSKIVPNDSVYSLYYVVFLGLISWTNEVWHNINTLYIGIIVTVISVCTFESITVQVYIGKLIILFVDKEEK